MKIETRCILAIVARGSLCVMAHFGLNILRII